jgi:uncharacterized protein (PEP-CTERM system associated)
MDLESEMTIHRKTFVTTAALIALAATMPATAKKAQVTPYLEVGQVVTADLKGDGDVLTYSTVAAGIDASISNARSEAQVNYRYERRFGFGKKLNDQDVHTGLARGRFGIVPNKLNIEAGGIATRARQDIRGSAPGLLVGNVDNIVQVYSGYVGPTLTTNVGDLKVSGAYRLGYTRAEAGKFTPAPGQPAVNQFDDSVTNLATASVGMESGVLPFGWTVSGAFEREDAGQLDQRFESKTVRGDVVLPVSPTVALVAGAGYEDIEASQRSALLDANGQPVVNGSGRFVTDKSSPRQLAYNQDGLFYDAGVVWRPNRRTNIQGRVGKRFGGLSYTGSATYLSSSATSFQVNIFDQVETFAQQLNDNLALLPTNFTNFNNPLNSQTGGCLFGGSGSGSAGGCLNPAFQSVNGSVFRSRGITGLVSTNRGPLNIGFGAGYAQRKYQAPTGVGIFSLNGITDESYFAQGQVAYQIDDVSNINAQVFASLFDSGIAGAPNVLSTGATGAYNRSFGRNLSTTAAVGLFSSRVDGQEGDLTGTVLLGLRYSF